MRLSRIELHLSKLSTIENERDGADAETGVAVLHSLSRAIQTECRERCLNGRADAVPVDVIDAHGLYLFSGAESEPLPRDDSDDRDDPAWRFLDEWINGDKETRLRVARNVATHAHAALLAAKIVYLMEDCARDTDSPTDTHEFIAALFSAAQEHGA